MILGNTQARPRIHQMDSDADICGLENEALSIPLFSRCMNLPLGVRLVLVD